MKNATLLLSLLLFVAYACGDKEPIPTFGEQLEGDWKVFSYFTAIQEIPLLPTDTIMMEFRNFDKEKGQVKWWKKWYWSDISAVDSGDYTISAADTANLQITWTVKDGALGGGLHNLLYVAKIDKDTLSVSAYNPPSSGGGRRFFTKAVRQ
ncbi:MAG TPA: hypothetical protein PK971_14630 [Saprospiraceae bacterium]|nr:hypothetical protein [Saprospiraceae bacterium]